MANYNATAWIDVTLKMDLTYEGQKPDPLAVRERAERQLRAALRMNEHQAVCEVQEIETACLSVKLKKGNGRG